MQIDFISTYGADAFSLWNVDGRMAVRTFNIESHSLCLLFCSLQSGFFDCIFVKLELYTHFITSLSASILPREGTTHKEVPMTEIQTYTNAAFGSVRILYEDGKPLFCGADACKALGYKNQHDALTRHCKGA